MAPPNTDAWEFENWCTENELTQDTITALTEAGFTSYKTLSLLDEAKVRQLFKKLQPAQLLLLIEGVSLFKVAKTQTSTRRNNSQDESEASEEMGRTDPKAILDAGGSLSPAQVLDILKENPTVASSFAPSRTTATCPDVTGESFLDPFQFGKGGFCSKNRAVPDYVSSLTRGEQPTTVTIGGVEFASNAPRRVPHEKLTMAQFMEGAIRITRDLVLEDGANLEQVMDYLNYLIQVAVFAQSFPWVNVLGYDKVYRKEQASLGFRWGTASPFLMTSQLQKPAPPTEGGSKKRTPTQARTDPKTGKTVCFRFNGHNGCQLKNCNFAHVCRACFEDHPEVQHKSDKHHQSKN